MSDKLLYAISTRGTMPLTEFYETFASEQANPEYESARKMKYVAQQKNRVIRDLAALAYCEFDFSARKVSACKSCLVALPSLLGRSAILTGARTPYLKRSLETLVASERDVFSVSTVEFDNRSCYSPFSEGNASWLPSTIFIQSSQPEKLQELATNLHLAAALGPPAAAILATFSASLDEILKRLDWKQHYKELDGWETRVFNPSLATLHFEKAEMTDCSLIEYTHYVTQQKRHYIKFGNHRAEINRDWGRYVILAWKRTNIIRYDKKTQKMAIPWTVPLPPILARAAALCSGLPPSVLQLGTRTGAAPEEVDVYSDVPWSVARSIAAKLSQRLVFGRIE